MSHRQVCHHCRIEIPLYAWVCPQCGVWVGDIVHAKTDHAVSGRIS